MAGSSKVYIIELVARTPTTTTAATTTNQKSANAVLEYTGRRILRQKSERSKEDEKIGVSSLVC